MVRAEGIITQVVFEHSLRIRMKEEGPARTGDTTATPSAAPSTATTPKVQTTELPLLEDGEATAEGSTNTSPSREGSETVGAPSEVAQSTTDIKGKAPESTPSPSTEATTPVPAPAPAPTSTSTSSPDANLVGRINNLISTDLDNISDSRDFMFLVIYSPLQIVLCIWFLYTFLQWSALVGMLVIILGLYIPGKVAQITHEVQIQRMKAVSSQYSRCYGLMLIDLYS